MSTIYFEDLVCDEPEEFGAYEVTADEITSFATKYDPQAFHLDPETAAQSTFGELIASGWHTAAICMRLLVDHHLGDAASLGGIGVDNLRWPAPVRPGDVLSVERTVIEKRASESRSDRGIVKSRIRATDRSGEEKLRMVVIGIYGRRYRD